MLVQLNAASRRNEDALALLLDCHERIRRFSAMALKLASATNEEPEVIRDAAERVHRYFAIALPLHVEDEEKSIRPRLDPIASDVVRTALERMSDEHEHIDALLEELLPIWDELRQEPTRLGRHQEQLQQATPTFQSMMEEHLRQEETSLFPSLRQSLGAETLEIIRTEMRARRRPPESSPPIAL